jgi:hypothetical protein
MEIGVYEFDPVIYTYKIWIVVGKSPAKISDYFLHCDNTQIKDIEQDTDKFLAFTQRVISKKNPSYGSIIFFRRKRDIADYNTVAHESSHAAKHLFEYINADMTAHEPFEFVIGWIAGCCQEVYKGKKEKLKL